MTFDKPAPRSSQYPYDYLPVGATEQTEAQDDGLKTTQFRRDALRNIASMSGANHIGNEELLGLLDDADLADSLRAQLEAARGELSAVVNAGHDEGCAGEDYDECACGWKQRSGAHKYIAELFADNATLRADLAQKMQEHQDALSEMRGRMEGAARDAARLDWLEARKSADTTFCAPGMHGGDDPTVWLVAVETTRDKYGGICYNYYGPTLRAAIDAALSPPSAGAV